jgi:spore maturation protein CgeB
VNTPKHASFELKLNGVEQIVVNGRVNKDTWKEKGALLQVKYFRKAELVLGRIPGIYQSHKVGNFIYLAPNDLGYFTVVVPVPNGVDRGELVILPWASGSVDHVEEPRFALVSEDSEHASADATPVMTSAIRLSDLLASGVAEKAEPTLEMASLLERYSDAAAELERQFRVHLDDMVPFNGSGTELVSVRKGDKPIQFTIKHFDQPIKIFMQISAGGLGANNAIITVRQFNEAGQEVPCEQPDFTRSSAKGIGLYRYVRPLRDNELHMVECGLLRPPEPNNRLVLELRYWKADCCALPIIFISNVSLWSSCFIVPDASVGNAGSNTVATIADEFTDACFKRQFNTISLTRQGCIDQIDQANPDILFVESAWKGVDGSWTGSQVGYDDERSATLKELILHCKAKGIPTVYWNKEDPPNFDRFYKWAGHFDQVYTTDVNCIPKYKEAFPTADVGAMPFFIEPRIHNPIGKSETQGCDVAFGGTWYSHKHPERIEFLPDLLRAASRYGLYIFDRQSGWNKDDTYRWPDDFLRFVRPKVSYEEMLHIHRLFKVLLNTNSVVDSPTMFSRRVFEVLASATPIVSTEGLGVREMFHGIVPVASSKQSADAILNKLMSSSWLRQVMGHVGYRHVMRNHTIAQRMAGVFAKAGRRIRIPILPPSATAVIVTKRPDMVANTLANLRRQVVRPIEVIIVLHDCPGVADAYRMALADYAPVRIISVDATKSLGYCLNLAALQISGDIMLKIDDDDYYGRHYVGDAVLPFMYASCAVSGKRARFIDNKNTSQFGLRFPGFQHCFTDIVAGGTLAIKRDVFDHVAFPEINVSEDSQFLKRVTDCGGRIYSSDPFSYCYVRDRNLSHSWQVQDTEVMRGVVVEGTTVNHELVEAGSDFLMQHAGDMFN